MSAKLITVGAYEPEEVLSYVTGELSERMYGFYWARMDSLRYRVFARPSFEKWKRQPRKPSDDVPTVQ